MRKLIVSNLISLDGFAAGPGGDLMKLPFDESFSLYNVERLRAAGTLLFGATTFSDFAPYWSQVEHDESQPAVEREIAAINHTIDTVVVSDTLPVDQTDAWNKTTRVLRRAEAHEQIAELKNGDGGDILAFGSITLANDLLEAGLVDEVHLQVGNAAIGAGVPMFSAGTGNLKLLEARQLDDSEHILLVYRT